MTRLTNTTILLYCTSRFHWRFSGNWQEHICERNIRCFWSPSHLSLGSDRSNVTVCRTCTVPLWDVQLTVKGSWSYWENILGWLVLRSPISPTSLFHHRIWYNFFRRGGPNDRMTVENIGKWQRVCSQHFVDGRPISQHPQSSKLLQWSHSSFQHFTLIPILILHQTKNTYFGKKKMLSIYTCQYCTCFMQLHFVTSVQFHSNRNASSWAPSQYNRPSFQVQGFPC